MIIGNPLKLLGFRSFIDIYSTANASVTATTEGKSFTATCDENGYARIKVKKKGDYNISSTGTTRVATATVTTKDPVIAEYSWGKYNILPVWTINWSWNGLLYSGTLGDSSRTCYSSYTFNSTTDGQMIASGSTWGMEYNSWVSWSGSCFNKGWWTSNPGWGTTLQNARRGYANGESYSGKKKFGVEGYDMSKSSSTTDTRGDFIENIQGNTLASYPSDGVSGGYWYVAI